MSGKAGGKGAKGGGKQASGGGKGSGKGNGLRWHCNLCSSHNVKMVNWGAYCSTCGKPKNQCLSTPRENNGIGRPPPQPSAAEPSYRNAVKGNGTKNVELDAIKEQNALLQELLDKANGKISGGAQQPRSSTTTTTGDGSAATVASVKKPVPGKELFVDFDGKPTSLDQLHDLLRSNLRNLGEANPRTIVLRQAIQEAQSLRQEQMEPGSRADYLDGVLKQKIAAATTAATAVDEAVAYIDEEQRKLQKLRERSAQIDKEVAQLRADYDAAVAANAEMQKRSAMQPPAPPPDHGHSQAQTYANLRAQKTVAKPLFKRWLEVQSPEVFEFLQEMQWDTGSYNGKHIIEYDRWEMHYLRIQLAMQTVRVEMGVELAPELQRIISNADESAIWMWESCKKPFFPEDVQWVREKLAQTRTPVRENIQKRAAEEASGQPEKRSRTSAVQVCHLSYFRKLMARLNRSWSMT